VNICVFLSAANVDERYGAPSREFAHLIGAAGHTLVWGGSDMGLMKVVADGVQAAGGRLYGVSVDFLSHLARPDADIMIVAGDLGERKARMLDAADAIVTLVGGSGTLDEFTDVFELKKQGKHDKPLVVINTGGFYDGLRAQLRHMESEGFLPRPLDDLVNFVATGRDALEYLDRALAAARQQ